jgi:hypothetical protein
MGLGSNTVGLDNLRSSMSATEMGVGASIFTVIVSMMLVRFGEYTWGQNSRDSRLSIENKNLERADILMRRKR